MWLARNKNKDLMLYAFMPSRNNEDGIWYSEDEDDGSILIDPDLEDVSKFNKLKWKDEPIEVKLILK